MKNFIQDGKRLTYTNSTGAVIASGTAVLVGTKVGVASVDIAASGGTGILAMEGVFELSKLSTDAVTLGASLYWDNTNNRLTTTVGSNTYAGYAFAAAAASTTTVRININK